MTTATIQAPETLGNLFPKRAPSTLPQQPSTNSAVKTISIDGGKTSLSNPFAPTAEQQASAIAIDNSTLMYRSYLYRVVFKGEEPSDVANNIIELNPTCGVRVILGQLPGRTTMIGALKRLISRLKADRVLNFSSPLPHGEILEAFALYVATENKQIN
jgi:hypothetical protein